MVTTEALLFGDRRSKSVAVVAVYLFLAFGTLAMAVLAAALVPDSALTRLLTVDAVPVVLFTAPGLIAIGAGYARCGAPASLAVGLVPGVAIVIVTTVVAIADLVSLGTAGESMLGVDFAGRVAYVGFIRAFLGYCAGLTIAVLVDARIDTPDNESDGKMDRDINRGADGSSDSGAERSRDRGRDTDGQSDGAV